MITCDKVSYLVEKNELEKLTFKEKINLKLHKAICKCCKNYESDSKVLSRLLKRLKHPNSKMCLSQEEKEVMNKNLNKQ